MTSLADITRRIVQSYSDVGGINHKDGVHLPSRAAVASILDDIEELCFPGFQREACLTDENVSAITGARVAQLVDAIAAQAKRGLAAEHDVRGDVVDPEIHSTASAFALEFVAGIPDIRALLALDVQALLEGDPAVRSREEVILAYPGLQAVLVHRVAHRFWLGGHRLLARMMSELVHGRTGIDIHPGARIGRHFYIDHGTGVVVGETTIIGDHVKLYQGVSLGARAVSRKMHDTKRHPTLEDHVTIYAGATILGGDTIVGHHSVVGGNVWLTKSVPPYSIVEREATVRVGTKDRDESFDPLI
jgi:serine O-acetyltransferase